MSILSDIKQMLGIPADATNYDVDLKININTAIAELRRAGIPKADTEFRITEGTEDWPAYLEELTTVDDIKTYIYLSVRLIFDPPPTSFGVNATKQILEKLIYLLNVECDKDISS